MDRKLANKILTDFAEAARRAHESGSGYAYTSGYFQSTIMGLLEKLKPHDCMAELDHFVRETRRLQKETVVNTLKEES